MMALLSSRPRRLLILPSKKKGKKKERRAITSLYLLKKPPRLPALPPPPPPPLLPLFSERKHTGEKKKRNRAPRPQSTRGCRTSAHLRDPRRLRRDVGVSEHRRERRLPVRHPHLRVPAQAVLAQGWALSGTEAMAQAASPRQLD